MSNVQKLTLERVVKRRKYLHIHKLWNSPTADNIDGWKRQFVTEEDKLMAMLILDALIVRSYESATSSLYYLLCSVLPKITNAELTFPQNLCATPHEVLRKAVYCNDFRILRLEPPELAHPSGQSADNVVRDLRSKYSANKRYFDIPLQAVPNVLLVDEFSGSGNQAERAISKWREILSSKTKISVFFMAIHERGLSKLKRIFPDVSVYATEILGRESCLLNHISDFFKLDSIELAQKKLTNFTEKNFKKEREILTLGYKKMSLCYKPPYTACNNMAGAYLLKTKTNDVRLFERGV